MKKTPDQLINDLQAICKEIGWCLAMDESSTKIKGLVIGQFKYVDALIEKLPDKDNFSIYSYDGNIDPEIH